SLHDALPISSEHVSSRAAQPVQPLQLCAEVPRCRVLAALHRRGDAPAQPSVGISYIGHWRHLSNIPRRHVRHQILRAAFDGAECFQIERSTQTRVLPSLRVTVPRHVADGHLFDAGWRWPYIVTTRLAWTAWWHTS